MDYINDYLKNKCTLSETYSIICNELVREADNLYEDTEKYDRLLKQKEQLQGIIAEKYMKEHGYDYDQEATYSVWKKIE